MINILEILLEIFLLDKPCEVNKEYSGLCLLLPTDNSIFQKGGC
jgi:hypothetical protein